MARPGPVSSSLFLNPEELACVASHCFFCERKSASESQSGRL
jgi:hypothetical protein